MKSPWCWILGFVLAAGSGSSSGETGLSAGQEFRDCDVCPMMVVIPAGRFMMGSPADQPGRQEDEGPQHEVSISAPLAVGKFEITKAEYAAFVADAGRDPGQGCWVRAGSGWGPNPSRDWRDPDFLQTDRHPVTCVNWEDAQAYVAWLSGKSGRRYRLLTESEWEYAARGGTKTVYAFGQELTTDQANFDGQSPGGDRDRNIYREGTTEVGLFPANAFGLHDMHGNLWEWTQDCWNATYEGAPRDGSSWQVGDCERHVLRGGSWTNKASAVRSADRVKHSGDPAARGSVDGFRVARDLN